MVKINRIYTRTGDDGTTGLVGGARVLKNSMRVHAYGEIDELNSWLGFTASLATAPSLSAVIPTLAIIQNELFDIGSEIASPPGSDLKSLPLVQQERIDQLERWIDSFSGNLPELQSFVLPGGDQITSAFHVARTVARRAERSLLTLHEKEPIRDVPLRYVNRLSDLLFSLARYSANQLGTTEVLWVPAQTRGR